MVGEVLNRFTGDESVSLPDTLNCCSLFFFFRYLHKGILYMFSAFTVRICDLGFFDLDSFFLFLFHIFIFLLDYAFASSYEECTVPSVDM